jgi:hypothetical protein
MKMGLGLLNEKKRQICIVDILQLDSDRGHVEQVRVNATAVARSRLPMRYAGTSLVSASITTKVHWSLTRAVSSPGFTCFCFFPTYAQIPST